MNGAVRSTETGGLWESQRLLPVALERGSEEEEHRGKDGDRVGGWMRRKGREQEKGRNCEGELQQKKWREREEQKEEVRPQRIWRQKEGGREADRLGRVGGDETTGRLDKDER